MEQKVIDHINTSTSRVIGWLERSRDASASAVIALISDIGKAFRGEAPFDAALIKRIDHLKNRTYLQPVLQEILSPTIEVYKDNYPWTIESPVIQGLIQRKHYDPSSQDTLSYIVGRYIAQMLSKVDNLDVAAFIAFLHGRGFTDEDIITICTQYKPFYQRPNRSENPVEDAENKKLTAFSEYLIPLLKNKGIKTLVDKTVFSRKQDYSNLADWMNILLDHNPEGIENYGEFLVYENAQQLAVNVPAIHLLIEKNAVGYEPIILQAIDAGEIEAGARYGIILELNRKLGGKHRASVEQTGEQNLQRFMKPDPTITYVTEPVVLGKLMSAAYFDYLFEQDAQSARTRLEKFYREAAFFNYRFFNDTYRRLDAEAIPILVEVLKKNTADVPSDDRNYDYYPQLFEILVKYDLTPDRAVLLDFAVKCTQKHIQAVACVILARDKDILADVQPLLTGKTIPQRITATLILSQLGTAEAAALLDDAVEAESSDDTRDIMLETLQNTKFKEPYTLAQVKTMVSNAAKRKKLNKWNEKWIEEAKLPKLYWKDQNTALDEETMRFLFYRMKRARGLNSDIEARQLLNYIDRDRSQAFAKALLVAFQDSNSDIKLKYYLTLAALLGDDDLMNSLNTLFKKNLADKRIKMAELVVGALAMIGSDKALRTVETIYRKLASKRPSVSEAARLALDAAAQEMNMTRDELADKIIPNFDFDGIYKVFTVDGDEYRAFINPEFKLNYFTEDNKIRKSLPTTAPKELKDEFKEIEKEVNDIVKSQNDRLEKYMIEERRWPVEHWRTFFFNHPIMSVYALKLLWGVYDQNGTLANTFYCSEDTSLYDVNDEEVTPEDDHYIGILHPLHLDEEALNAWKDKLYTLSMVTIFPIIERPIHRINDQERELSLTKAFFEQEIPKGADFVNTFLVKRNWRKSTSDGGSVEFTKFYKDGLIRAHANIEGPSAWYQGGTAKATMYEVSFLGKNWNERVILKNVPPVFYSEVMADIDLMINAN